jgi:dolichol kinase
MRHTKAEFLFELKRKMFHFILGTVLAYIIYYTYPPYGNLILLPLMLAVIIMRMIPYFPMPHPVSKHLLYHFEREHDKKHFPYKGAIFFGIGIIPPVLLLPLDAATGRPLLACAVITILAGGDAFSTLVGKFYGKYRIGHKSVEGFLAFIISGYMMATLFLPHDLKACIALAVIGAVIEMASSIDDNLAIPIGLTIVIEAVNAVAPHTLF